MATDVFVGKIRIDRKRCSILIWCLVYGLLGFFSAFLALSHCGLKGTTDEFGYFSNAALISLKNLSSLQDNMPYYGWFYSVFLAIFLLPHKVDFYMISAAVFNVVLYLSCVPFVNGILKRLTSFSSTMRAVISFVTMLYPFFIYNSAKLWSETLTCFLLWGVLYLSLLFFEKPSAKNLLFWSLFGFMAFFTHKRNAVVLVAILLILIISVCTKKVKARYLLIYALTSIALGAVEYVVASTFSRKLFPDGLSQQNSIYGLIKAFVSSDGTGGGLVSNIKYLFFLVFGEMWYVSCATCLIAIVGFVFCLYFVIKKNSDNKLFYGFLLLLVLGAVCLSCLYWSGNMKYYTWHDCYYRIDTMFYGRYIDFYSGALLMIGLCMIVNVCYGKIKWRQYLSILSVGSLLCLIGAILLYFRIDSLKGVLMINFDTTSSIAFFKLFGALSSSSIISVTLMAFIFQILMLLIMALSKADKHEHRLIALLPCVVVVLMFSITLNYLCLALAPNYKNTELYGISRLIINDSTDNSANEKVEVQILCMPWTSYNVESISEVCVLFDKDKKPYYISDYDMYTKSYKMRCMLSVFMPDANISYNESCDPSSEYIVTVPLIAESILEAENNNYSAIYASDNYVVLRIGGN